MELVLGFGDRFDKLGGIRPSKYALDKQEVLHGLSAGSMCKRIFIKCSALREIFPTYFFCKVSGLDISGNFRPVIWTCFCEISEIWGRDNWGKKLVAWRFISRLDGDGDGGERKEG